MNQKTIMLACAAGMSTSLMVTKMKTAAKEKGLDYEIFALPMSEAKKRILETSIDVVLLGPQLSYMEGEFAKLLEGTGIPIGVINFQDYGLMNGVKVIEFAQSLMEKEV